MEPLLKTGDVLKRTGISREVFYRYLNVGLIRPARVSDGGHTSSAQSPA